MPPKDTPTGSLYFSAGGELKPLAHITELPEISKTVVPPNNDIAGSIIEDMVIEGFFTLAWPVSISEKLLILTGKYPSNNWLKMHGYPMRRRRNVQRRT